MGKSLSLTLVGGLCVWLSACGGGLVDPNATSANGLGDKISTLAQGKGSVAPAQAVLPKGKSITFSAQPAAGYSLSQVSGCNAAQEGNEIQVLASGSDCTLSLVFTPNFTALTQLSARNSDGVIEVTWQNDNPAQQVALYYSQQADFTIDSPSTADVQQLIPAGSPARLTQLLPGQTYFLVAVPQIDGSKGPISTKLSLRPKGFNDTGISDCGNGFSNTNSCSDTADFPRQDAQFGRDTRRALPKIGAGRTGFDFTKLDAKGQVLAATTSQWSCVKDNHTGLIWEIKSRQATGIQNNQWTYSWYNTNAVTNGGDSGKANGGICQGLSCDTQSYVQAVNQLKPCGLANWRLPEREELRSIIDYSLHMPSLDTQYFADIQPGGYWTATASTDGNAWNLNFYIGNSADLSKTSDYYVMLVSGN